ncbi:MAG: hypothetical protein LBT48_06305 [Prevotellaceae bacterium]|jgi:hypothetical protein|nr:hypothetical protein [Prevotellaceae bacterium]
MEEYLPLLIAAGILLLRLFASNKKKPQSQRTAPMPSFPDLSDIFPIPAQQPDKKAEEFRKPEPVLITEYLDEVPEIEGGRVADSEQKLQAMRQPKEVEIPENQSLKRHPLIADFDIPHAIIYSEILHPKYLE